MRMGFNITGLSVNLVNQQGTTFYKSGGTPIPPPPYAVFSLDGSMVLLNIMAPSYQIGTGPGAASVSFGLYASGLIPTGGNITITPPTDIEIYNPNSAAWTNSAFNIAYTGGAIILLGFMVRLKVGLSVNSYTENVTITAPNTQAFNTTVNSSVIASTYIVATGGNITDTGNMRTHMFTSDGIFNVTSNPSNQTVRVLIVAGGGGGGGFAYGAGGGAGGWNEDFANAVGTGSKSVVVGAGGIGGPNINTPSIATNGNNSSFNSIISIGGGKGGNFGLPAITVNSGGDGGSGGGSIPTNGMVGLGIIGQGNDGGSGALFSVGVGDAFGGGGGGAGQIGANAIALSNTTGFGGNGGNGLQSNITGVNTYYAGGGAGGNSAGNNSSGGLGGGAGTTGGGNGSNATANTGGGGSGCGNVFPASGGNGGSGVVIITYQFKP